MNFTGKLLWKKRTLVSLETFEDPDMGGSHITRQVQCMGISLTNPGNKKLSIAKMITALENFFDKHYTNFLYIDTVIVEKYNTKVVKQDMRISVSTLFSGVGPVQRKEIGLVKSL